MTVYKEGDPTTLGRLYGRRHGHKLRGAQQRLLDVRLPALAVPEGPLGAERLFGDKRSLAFEIGFGGGEHLAWQAAAHPEIGFIGAEPFVNGVAQCLQRVEDAGLVNVRLHMGDALGVLERLADASLERLYLLHPDPWPKARHAKRRMMNPGPLDLFAAKLAPGGRFRFTTDNPVYLRWALVQMARRRDFEWLAETAADFLKRPPDWPETRYATKAKREGRAPWFFEYRRV